MRTELCSASGAVTVALEARLDSPGALTVKSVYGVDKEKLTCSLLSVTAGRNPVLIDPESVPCHPKG